MNNQDSPDQNATMNDQAAKNSALFANLVLQYTNMALIFMGRVPHPETGKTAVDLNHAQYFIDQLEMLEAKTKGNLDKQEQGLLAQSLTTLRMAFVEAVSGGAARSVEPQASASAPDEEKVEGSADAPSSDEDSKKKFSKKY